MEQKLYMIKQQDVALVSVEKENSMDSEILKKEASDFITIQLTTLAPASKIRNIIHILSGNKSGYC